MGNDRKRGPTEAAVSRKRPKFEMGISYGKMLIVADLPATCVIIGSCDCLKKKTD